MPQYKILDMRAVDIGVFSELNAKKTLVQPQNPGFMGFGCTVGCVIIFKISLNKNGECYFYGLGHFKLGKSGKKIKKIILLC